MSDLETPSLNGLSFTQRVNERKVGPLRLLTLQTPVESVVSMHGSFLSYPNFDAGESLLQILTVGLLDRGTKSRDRFEIAQLLEDRGAKLNLFADGTRIGFSAKALQKDVPVVVDVLTDILREPLFDPEEFAKAKSRVGARFQRMLESTSKQADAALSRALYNRNHPNYNPKPEEHLKRLTELTVEDVRGYHQEHFGSNDFIVTAVGDVDESALEKALMDTCGDWEPHSATATFETQMPLVEPTKAVVPMAEKTNLDVSMGHVLPLRRQEDDYIPLYLGNYVLGGNFSARLMTVVRDDMGLTYGIGSGLSGVTTSYNGHWLVHVTLSQDRLEEGIAATREQITLLKDEGVTEEELDDKKTTMAGSFKVRLAKTSNLGEILLTNAERGFSLEYLDNYPRLIQETTHQQVNDAIRRYLKPEALHLALAGSVPEPAEQS